MADVLTWLEENSATEAAGLATRSLGVIDSALHVYKPEEVCFSFNGGKDSTVVFHLLRAACLRRARADEAADPEAAAAALLRRVRTVYFEVEDNFPEVEAFMEETCAAYGLSLVRLPPFKAGLMELIERHGIRAVLIGTRQNDPDGGEPGRARERPAAEAAKTTNAAASLPPRLPPPRPQSGLSTSAPPPPAGPP